MSQGGLYSRPPGRSEALSSPAAGFGARSAANGTAEANDAYFAICFLGDASAGRAGVTPEVRRALTALIREYRRRYRGARRVRPHSDFSATSCPGDELRGLIAKL